MKMTETQKRIEAYKKALPEIREKVMAVALLLVMSMAMMTSATFAWLTISRAPEVTEVSTTVAANGNLEIALATSETAPGESQVGDSSATEGQTIVNANKTWGNLINLSDPSYGLENLTLRPAQLNKAALLTSPLWGAEYSIDGRIIKLNSDFKYSIWDGNYFVVNENDYGVRAISSAEYLKDETDANKEAEEIEEGKKRVAENNQKAATAYSELSNESGYMQSLANMMGLYMTARMNPGEASLNNPTVAIEDIQNLRDMYKSFIDCFALEADAIAELINFSLAMQNYDSYKNGEYKPEKVYTKIDILGTLIEVAEDETITETTATKVTTNQLKNLEVQIGNKNHKDGTKVNDLEQFQADYKTILDDYKKLVDICKSGTSFKWTDTGINNIVNNLVNVGACTIGADNTPISSIGASNAMGYLSGTQEARITNGILYRFEERVGGYIEVKNLSISATVKRMGMTIPATVKANIQTTASREYSIFGEDYAVVEEIVKELDLGDLVYMAQDTYGLAVDLWVRTNAESSYLTLEGNVLTKSETVRATGKDANGNEVELYTVTISFEDEETGETVSNSIDVYKVVTKDENENDITEWYNATSHTVLTAEELGEQTPNPKMVEVITVTGFEGENRVWNGKKYSTMLSTDSTTQGSGSCYVYYADNPEDQARSLKLLEAFNVAFVGDDGKLLATAVMDTENFFAENGRVIVPLVLSTSESINFGEDEKGNPTYAITILEKNVPTRITAIVYLDGTKLTNQEVLAASEIQGKLNIQFGSSMEMEPIDNEALQGEELRVSATVSKNSFVFADASEENPMTTTVTVSVDGDEPSAVTAFFLRQISATQGSREETMTFAKNAEGKWVADYTFDAPGNYVLRTVTLDGVDYDLASPPEVKIEGYSVTSIAYGSTSGSHINIMTAASSYTENLTLGFGTSDPTKMPKTVQGRFLKDDDGSAVNIDFAYDANGGIWKGSATFLSSGDYTLEYVLLDGEYEYLEEGMRKTASITLGMRVAVYTTSPTIPFKYVPSEMKDNEKLLGMQVKVMDNEGNELRGLTDVILTYGMRGSGIKKMDTDLKWNGTYYVGELTNGGPGIWQFSNVEIKIGEQTNTLTTATTSPTFTILSPEPPEYVTKYTSTYQYAPNKDATMNVVVSNAAAASASAVIKNDKTGDEYTVVSGEKQKTIENDGTTAKFEFTVPGDANGYQDGNWTLTAIRLWDVFAEDGTAYTKEEPLEIDVSDTNNVTKVVNRITVTFAEGQSKDFGKDANGNVSATFMTSHTISGLNVDIKDFEGNAVQGVSDVQLTFTYGNNSGTYGGYTSTSLTNATEGAIVTVALDTNSGTNYAQSKDATILYAGSYSTTFSFKVSGTEYKYAGTEDDASKGTKALPANAPVFTVWSKVPYVKFTATNPEAGTTFTGINATENGNVTRTNSISDDRYSVTCYYKGEISDNGCEQACSGYTASKATLTLYDMGTLFSNATCTITSKSSGPDIVYTFTPNATSNEQNVGSTSGSGSSAKRLGVGINAEGTQLIVTGTDGNTYTFTLKNKIYATATE